MQEQGGSQNHDSPLKSKSNAKRTRVKTTSSNVDKELIKLNIASHSNTYQRATAKITIMGASNSVVANQIDQPFTIITFNNADKVYAAYKHLYQVAPFGQSQVEAAAD
jgi:hypothetical protein